MDQFFEEMVDETTCPICGSIAATKQTNTRQLVDCYTCGYNQTIEVDPETKRFQVQSFLGFGGYTVRLINSNLTEVGSFAQAEAIDAFIEHVSLNKDIIEYASYTTYLNGKIEHHILQNKTSNRF